MQPASRPKETSEYEIAQMPRIYGQSDMTCSTTIGVPNPFFSVHDGASTDARP